MRNRWNNKMIIIFFSAMICLLAIIFGVIIIKNRIDNKQVMKDSDKLQTYTYSTIEDAVYQEEQSYTPIEESEPEDVYVPLDDAIEAAPATE